ncbi:phosphoribosylglycinamide formyltransferase [Sutterella wadsworthensis]|uniref:phosphoribosylglycinamide formyltransferase n=1 Tax=Sutterella wadsworthensis TaxID=40545 RepID=UPI001C01F6FA|nr:phosphoribosylglycinamide formyltransferase [Sutterella wadsworthensis]MBS6231323.1 phosphoribosylglycinamide formyltransferase [Sutterella wadsworthensis]MBT9622588.1 phosphoribosylglycinamide formyltransferase [Sutterella wadsworthensis]MCB7456620.1 phosphoribosylglycinamide formyltransferase [Sutterella wadsworthensis]
MKNIVVLISGRGSNFEAILRTARSEDWEGRLGLKIAAVISNRPLAKGLDTARREGIDAVAVDHKAYPTREAFEEALAAAIEPYKPAVIVLAGFMRILTESFVARWEGKILNIHPALLPLFPGLDTHQRAIDAGCRVHGSTVHFVSSVLDGGAIIGQSVVPVLPSDTDETLAARLLPYEHKLYPQCVKAVALGEVKLIDGKAVMSDEVAHHLAIFWRKD